MNQELEKGIKLSGTYHNKKDVYVDAENSWVIPVECIKSVDYKLEETDALACIIKFMSTHIKETKILKGVLNNEIVDRQFEFYTRLNDMKKLAAMGIDREPAQALDISYIREYVWNLPEVLVDDYLSNNVTVEEAEALLPKLLENEKDESNYNASYAKRVIMAYHIFTDDIHRNNVVKTMQRGY